MIIKREIYIIHYTFYNYLLTFIIHLFIYTITHLPRIPKKKGSKQQEHQPFPSIQCSLNLNIIKIPTRIFP